MDEGAIQLQVERAQAGESQALEQLARTLRPDVVRLCTRLLGRNDAQDFANEALLRAQQRLDQYDPSQPFRRWVLSIASHHCIDGLRRRATEKRLFEPEKSDLEEPAAAQHSALDRIVQAQRQATVQAALDRLPTRYRAPLVLRYYAELDYDSIGKELELTRNQVATLLFRAKQRLRELLRGGLGEQP